jgi:NADH dehydrogenase
MKTIDDAIELRNTLLLEMEAATLATDETEKQKLTTIVIAGGGPTGVEIAGMLAEMRMNILKKDYPELKNSNVRICLADGAPVVLAPMSEKSQKYTYETLVEMGVEVKLNKQVKDYLDNEVIFADGETIKTKSLIWTAGVTSKVFDGIPQESYGRGRRLVVDEYNLVQVTDVDKRILRKIRELY